MAERDFSFDQEEPVSTPVFIPDDEHPMFFAPVFKTSQDDGNEFIILHAGFAGRTKEDLDGSFFQEHFLALVLFGLKEIEVREFDMRNLPHAKGAIGPYRVAIISGPLFEQAAQVILPPEAGND